MFPCLKWWGSIKWQGYLGFHLKEGSLFSYFMLLMMKKIIDRFHGFTPDTPVNKWWMIIESIDLNDFSSKTSCLNQQSLQSGFVYVYIKNLSKMSCLEIKWYHGTCLLSSRKQAAHSPPTLFVSGQSDPGGQSEEGTTLCLDVMQPLEGSVVLWSVQTCHLVLVVFFDCIFFGEKKNHLYVLFWGVWLTWTKNRHIVDNYYRLCLQVQFDYMISCI